MDFFNKFQVVISFFKMLGYKITQNLKTMTTFKIIKIMEINFTYYTLYKDKPSDSCFFMLLSLSLKIEKPKRKNTKGF